MRRGFVFTLDALLSLVLISFFLVGIVASLYQSQNVYGTYLRGESKYTAENTLKILRTVPLRNLVPPDIIENWSSGDEKSAVLYSDLVSPDMSPLEIVATYWATGPLYPKRDLRHKAEIILGYILNSTLKGYDYELLINNYTSPYLRKVGADPSKVPEVSPATLVMSGYAYNQTPRGYMARAYLTKLGSKETSYIYTGMEYMGYGYYTNSNTPIDVKMIVPNEKLLPDDANIIEVKWWPYVDPMFGGKVQLYIDGEGVTCGQYKANTWVKVTKQEILVDDSLSNSCNMLDIIKRHSSQRYHVFEVKEYLPYYDDINIGPVFQFITLTYTTSKLSTFRYPKVTYFDSFSSYYLPIVVGKHVFIPGNLTNFEVSIHVKNLPSDAKATLYINNKKISVVSPNSNGVFSWSNSTIANVLNYSTLSGHYAFVEIYINSNTHDYTDKAINPPVQIVYDKTLSFIKIDYTYKLATLTPYTIDITKEINQNNIVSSTGCSAPSGGLTLCTGLTWRYDIPKNVIPVWTLMYFDVYTGYSGGTMKVKIKNSEIPWTEIFNENYRIWYMGIPNPTRDTTGRLVIPTFASGDNYIDVSLTGSYDISKEFSQGSYTYLIQAYAGYGDVFPKYIRDGCKGYNITYYWVGDSNPHYITAGDPPYCDVTAEDLLKNRTTYAVDDAIVRLFNNLGGDGTEDNPILVELPSTVNIDFASMGNIPGLFKPIQITLRVWREG
ncbi:hypothetical protein [Thermococcus sp. AM4]|uniref:hypothetical protein n=1 Tax=Thermococcus sp. (strain AM4) TaxID=246969 RepID=UPI00022997D0|nr:hypothetical protein [Thermococcus sp. AM4]EEB74753.2 hypothetical protein TAM4_698 [Thermococcus sp. AM4]